MDAEEIKERMRTGESLRTELKAAAIQPDQLAASLVAFANTPGGELILGVYYVRTFSGRRQASREELLRIIQAAQSLYASTTRSRSGNARTEITDVCVSRSGSVRGLSETDQSCNIHS